MTTEHVRAGSGWLALREQADAAARSAELVEILRPYLPTDGPGDDLVIHDLGSGTGSMSRWLAPQLRGSQRWVLHDRDGELLDLAATHQPARAADGGAVTVETRLDDITRLEPGDLAGVSLVTASALLDMFTEDELDRFVACCDAAGCPVLVTLSVLGQVDLAPADPFDRRVTDAFNAHQRRHTAGGHLLGPDAAGAAAAALERRGLEVIVRPSPWRLGPQHSDLAGEWLTGWVEAACEQAPELAESAQPYARRRLAEVADGSLDITVEHVDLLALPVS